MIDARDEGTIAKRDNWWPPCSSRHIVIFGGEWTHCRKRTIKKIHRSPKFPAHSGWRRVCPKILYIQGQIGTPFHGISLV